MSNLKIYYSVVGEVGTNCYLVKNEDGGDGFIIDPGDEALRISALISKMEMTPEAILLTHGHFDHIGAVEELKKRYNIPVYISRTEDPYLHDTRKNLSEMFGRPTVTRADVLLNDGQKINVAGIDMSVILTPGHTEGSCCYYLEEDGILFSGDTLFCASRGRTDYPGGSESSILRSIREKLLVLPEKTVVYPGHMETTTIGAEKLYY